MPRNSCVFERELSDGKIRYNVAEDGFTVNVLGDLNKERFTNKGYIIARRGLTSNSPSIIFPNKDRDAGELLFTEPKLWNVNASAFFEVYPELRNTPKCKCETI